MTICTSCILTALLIRLVWTCFRSQTWARVFFISKHPDQCFPLLYFLFHSYCGFPSPGVNRQQQEADRSNSDVPDVWS